MSGGYWNRSGRRSGGHRAARIVAPAGNDLIAATLLAQIDAEWAKQGLTEAQRVAKTADLLAKLGRAPVPQPGRSQEPEPEERKEAR